MGISNLKQGGGTDWSKMTPQFTVANTNATSASSPGTIMNATGQGILTGLTLKGISSSSVSSVRLTIDGVVGNWMESSGASLEGVPIIHRFNTSLKVEAYGSSSPTYIGVSYNLV